MRYQQTVSISQLMRPYPQNYNLNEDYTPGNSSRYHALQLEVHRPFKDGLSMMLAYNYHYEQDQYFYDAVDQYQEKWSWQPYANPRHRISEASVWELSVGKGRHFLPQLSRGADYLISGWSLGTVLSWRSGRYASFGEMVQVSNPSENVPAGYYWNPAAFQPLPAYTRRSNQNVYSGITGPGYFNLDASLSKSFAISERVKVRADLTAYNALNNFTGSDPNTNVYDLSQFGRSTEQLGGTYGRRVEVKLRVNF